MHTRKHRQRTKSQQTRKQSRHRPRSRVIIPISSSGEMGAYGYCNLKEVSIKERHSALEKMTGGDIVKMFPYFSRTMHTHTRKQRHQTKSQQTRKQSRHRPRSRVIIPISSSGEMGAYGYCNLKELSIKERHSALEKMIEKESIKLQISREEKIRSIIARLNALAIVTKNRNPKLSSIFRKDQQWLSRKLDEEQK